MAAAGFERHVLRICGVVACAFALLLCLSATSALAQDEPGRGARTTKDVPRSVERLWREYPLNPTPAGAPPSSTEPTRPQAPRPGSTSARGDEDDGFPTGPVTLVFVGVAIALFGALALFALTPATQPRHTRRRVALHLPRLRNGEPKIVAQRRRRHLRGGWWGDDDGGETSRAPSKPTSQESAVGEEIFVPQSLRARSDPMSNQPEQARHEFGAPDEREVVPHEPVDSDTATDYARVGEKVAGVLASAQQAADQMLRSAREEADRVRSEALEQAAASPVEALSEATRMQRESERLRFEVETYSKETRDAADAYAAGIRAAAEPEAERRLAEADEHAQAIVAEAEQRARHVAQEEVRRQEALAAGVERYEERLKNLLEVFRGMATQLEDLIRTNQEAKDREEDSAEAEQDAEAPADEALEEALWPERQTHARPTWPRGR